MPNILRVNDQLTFSTCRGIEALADAHPSSEISTPRVALSLLCGFTFMLIVEQLFSSHSHSPASASNSTANVKPTNSEVQFDAELAELEGEQGMTRSTVDWVAPVQAESSAQMQAIPLTLGLVIHSLADGFALGVSFFPSNESKNSSSLSAIVFLAIIIHKRACQNHAPECNFAHHFFLVVPTSLALTSSLLATSLSRPQCKKHLAVFSVSTPIAALLSYVALDFFGSAEHANWPGTALLLSVRLSFRSCLLVLMSFTGRNFPECGDARFSSIRCKPFRNERESTLDPHSPRDICPLSFELTAWTWTLDSPSIDHFCCTFSPYLYHLYIL